MAVWRKQQPCLQPTYLGAVTAGRCSAASHRRGAGQHQGIFDVFGHGVGAVQHRHVGPFESVHSGLTVPLQLLQLAHDPGGLGVARGMGNNLRTRFHVAAATTPRPRQP